MIEYKIANIETICFLRRKILTIQSLHRYIEGSISECKGRRKTRSA